MLILSVFGAVFLASCRPTDVTNAGSAEDESAAHSPDDFTLDIGALTELDISAGGRLRVVVTTNIVADVVSVVGGDAIEMTALIPLGADPHTYEPTPQDYQRIENAQVVFISGVGLEEAMRDILTQAAQRVPIISLSQGVTLLEFANTAESGSGAPEPSHEDAHASEDGMDPHVWLDLWNVMQWADNAARALSVLDPAHADSYRANAAQYQEQLLALDAFIQAEVSRIPENRRRLVTDHYALQYFAARYGFEIVGAVIPAYSTGAQTSAKDLAALIDAMRELDVGAVFVGIGANTRLAAQAAQDTGVALVPLYVGSLSGTDGPAATYLDFMRYDVGEIVRALGK